MSTITFVDDTAGVRGARFPRPAGPVPRPTILEGQANGLLPDSLLVPVYSGLRDGRPAFGIRNGYVANRTSARKHRAFAYDCWWHTNELPIPISATDSYRPLAVQERIFRERYAPGGSFGGCKTWRGLRWCKTGNFATAATPGSSNHGWGDAIDYRVLRADGAVVPIGGTRADTWARARCLDYGLAYETVPEEDWHIRNYTGDDIPRAVLAYEAQVGSPDSTPRTGDDPAGAVLAAPVDVDLVLGVIRQFESGGRYDAPPNRAGASGAYQYIRSTWSGYGGFTDAYLAPSAIQDARARNDVTWILATHGGDVSAVPVAWYFPAALRDPALMDRVPKPELGNTLTPRQYQQRWLALYRERLAVRPLAIPTVPQEDDDVAIKHPIVQQVGKLAVWRTNGVARCHLPTELGIRQAAFELGLLNDFEAWGDVIGRPDDRLNDAQVRAKCVTMVGSLDGYGGVVGRDPGDV